MARYELRDPRRTARFWEIELDGNAYRTSAGMIDGHAFQKRMEFGTEGEARAAYENAIAEQESKGYRLVGKTGELAPAPEPEPTDTGSVLARRIEANPDDEGAYLVLADWLQSEGKPRGELIMLHHAGNQTAADALIAKHEMLGRFANFKAQGRRRRFDVEWRLGFVKRLSIGWEPFEDEHNTAGIAADDIGELFGNPSFRFLRELEIGPVPSDEMMDPDAVIEAVCEHAPLSLRVIKMCNPGAWDISQSASGDFGPVAETFTKLEKVTLHGGSIGMAEMRLGDLRELNIETGAFSSRGFRMVCQSEIPKLETLRVWFGEPDFGADCAPKDVVPFLAGHLFPKLTHLGLMNCAFVNELIDPLIESALLKRLTNLDLSMGNLSDASVEKMLDAEDMFSHLEWLNLDDNALTDKHRTAVLSLAKSVNFGKSHDPDRVGERPYRYVSVGE